MIYARFLYQLSPLCQYTPNMIACLNLQNWYIHFRYDWVQCGPVNMSSLSSIVFSLKTKLSMRRKNSYLNVFFYSHLASLVISADKYVALDVYSNRRSFFSRGWDNVFSFTLSGVTRINLTEIHLSHVCTFIRYLFQPPVYIVASANDITVTLF